MTLRGAWGLGFPHNAPNCVDSGEGISAFSVVHGIVTPSELEYPPLLCLAVMLVRSTLAMVTPDHGVG